MLKIVDLEVGYGDMQVLWKPSLNVAEGSITCLIGPNGAGKSTLLLSILGTLTPWAGQVLYQDCEITTLPPHRKVNQGLTLVPEGKHIFSGMTVRENLQMGAYRRQAGTQSGESLELVYTLFPILKERSSQLAGSLSGGQQQMLTIGRALMSRPQLVMLDEPSQGLAPKLVGEVFDTIKKLRSEIGLTILLVEQNTAVSLDAADHVYIMHEGQIKAEGTPDKIKDSLEIRKAYLGL